MESFFCLGLLISELLLTEQGRFILPEVDRGWGGTDGPYDVDVEQVRLAFPIHYFVYGIEAVVS
jgi:hypothetical protein